MKKSFAHYYKLTEQELSAVLDSGLFALDANVLLDLYRYSASTRRDLMRILRKLRSRLWLPHQAAQEFHANRLGVLKETASKVAEADKALAALRKAVDAIYRTPGEVTGRQPRDAVAGAFSRVEKHLTGTRNAVIAPTVDPGADRVWTGLTALFEGRVGDPFEESRLAELYKEGAKRYLLRRPPGYEDSQKPEPERFGDFILWRQILDKAKTAGRPVVLITSERKADWWILQDGESMGPRPELRAEMMSEAGQLWHMYRPGLFMSVMGDRLEVPASQPALDEVRTVADRAPMRDARTAARRYGTTYEDLLRAVGNATRLDAFATGVAASNLDLMKGVSRTFSAKEYLDAVANYGAVNREVFETLKSATLLPRFTALADLARPEGDDDAVDEDVDTEAEPDEGDQEPQP